MRYLITGLDEPFFTERFDPENDWEKGVVVFDLKYSQYMDDGNYWKDIMEDSF